MVEPITKSSNNRMPSRPQESSWDFSHVLDLINTLSPSAPAAAKSGTISTDTAQDQPEDVPELTDGSAASSLGNFNKVWDFLGTPRDGPLPTFSVAAAVGSDHAHEREAYTSDGAISYAPINKGVRWKDHVNGLEGLADAIEAEADADADADDFGITPESPSKLSKGLTKTQRKKANRKARREAKAERKAAKSKTVSDLESEDDSNARKEPARKASFHALPSIEQESTQPTHKYNLRPRKTPSTPQVTKVQTVIQQPPMAATEPKKRSGPANVAELRLSDPIDIPNKGSTRNVKASPIPFNLPIRDCGQDQKSQGKSLQPSALSLVPSSVMPKSPKRSKKSAKAAPAPITGLDSAKHDVSAEPATPQFHDQSSPTHRPSASGPRNAFSNQLPLYFQSSGSPNSQGPSKELVIRDKDDRHIHFLLTLIRNFGEDKHWLAKPAQLVNHVGSPTGIHVFIDFSNIHIGFQNRIKSVRGLPTHARIRREDLDFDAFVLLMERRRPVAKRVLVGSLPAIPAFEKAKAIGYETNILDKVFKARELTERQKYFRQRDAERRKGHPPPNTTSGDASSGSETNAAPQFAKEAWVEQGVDEILHLKILESVVDVETPSTIVLATGDAAQAEYSQGFMRMVERALKKGWRVELVSWRDGISGAYRQDRFRVKWRDQFRIIELDDYVEDLLDT